MLKHDGRNRMELCECCQCDPCDCHGVNDEECEFWGMVKNGSDQVREDHGLDGQGSGCQPVPSVKMATGGHPQDRILSEGLFCTCNYTGQADKWDNSTGRQVHGD